jgi:tetratricopeptide (TPR) repeat protein
LNTFSKHLAALKGIDPARLKRLGSLSLEMDSSDAHWRLTDLASDLLEATAATETTMELAVDGYRSSGSLPGPDCWEERAELLGQFSFVAWRHAVALGRWGVASHWRNSFNEALQGAELPLSGAGQALEAIVGGSNERATSYDLLRITAWLKCLLNEKAWLAALESSRLRRAIEAIDWPVLSLDERRAILFDLSLAEATSRRCQGEVDVAASVLTSLLAQKDWLARAGWARIECEAEWIVLLHEATAAPEVLRLAPIFIERCREPWSKRPKTKVQIALGNALLGMGRYAEAVSLLTGLLRDPWLAREPQLWLAARQNFCSALLHCGDTTQALAQLRRAGRLATVLRTAHISSSFDIHRAETLRFLGRLQESAEILEVTATRLDRQHYSGWAGYARLLLGETLVAMGKHVEAARQLRTASIQLRSSGKEIEGLVAERLITQLERTGNAVDGRPTTSNLADRRPRKSPPI